MLNREQRVLWVLAASSLALSGCLSDASNVRPPNSSPPPVAEAEAPPPPPPPPAPMPPPSCEMPSAGQSPNFAGCKTGDTLVLHGVNFEFNKATLTVNAKTLLDQVAAALQARPDIKVEIDGYTDGVGSASYNLKLSARRADAVKSYLITRGVAPERLSARGLGMANPVAGNDTDEGRELNRRVELKVLEAAAPAAATTPSMSSPPTPAAPAPAPAAASGSASITISGFAFVPATLTVAPGTTVTWTNQDTVAHIVKFADQASGYLHTGESYRRTFTTTGTFDYQCGVHPGMTGKIVVQ